MPKDEKRRARMVVEEVGPSSEPTMESQVPDEIIEKVEELQDLTENISESVEKSENLEQEILTAVETPFVESAPAEPIESDTVPEAELPVEEHYSIQEDAKDVRFDQVPVLKRSNTSNPLVIIIPGIFLLGALLGGIYFYQKGVGPITIDTPTPIPANVIETTPAPSASPSGLLDLTKYPVNIMNGSGIVGEAGRAKTTLETAGFKVSGTGNASSYDFTKTVIKAKADVPANFLSQLSTALSKSYVLDTNQVLSLSSPDSVQVIVGSSKAK